MYNSFVVRMYTHDYGAARVYLIVLNLLIYSIINDKIDYMRRIYKTLKLQLARIFHFSIICSNCSLWILIYSSLVVRMYAHNYGAVQDYLLVLLFKEHIYRDNIYSIQVKDVRCLTFVWFYSFLTIMAFLTLLSKTFL